MFKLNLPEYQFNLRKSERSTEIFDTIRRKFVVLTPEEWVRQNFIRFLTEEKKFPLTRMAVEMEIKINDLKKRCDVIVYKTGLISPLLLIECKAPSVKITQDVFDQAARYNLFLKVEYFVLTNGLSHYFCKYSLTDQKYEFIREIPVYSDL